SQVAKSGVLSFERFVIIVKEPIGSAWIREWKFSTWVDIAEQNIGDGPATFIAWVVSHQNCFGTLRYAIDNSGTSFDQDHHHRLTSGLDSLSKSYLRFTEIQISNIAGRFTIRTFTQTEDHHVGILC